MPGFKPDFCYVLFVLGVTQDKAVLLRIIILRHKLFICPILFGYMSQTLVKNIFNMVVVQRIINDLPVSAVLNEIGFF